MRRTTLFLASILATVSMMAATFTGTVVDENTQPLPYANVVLLNYVDSTYLAGTTTSEDGTFTLTSDKPNTIVKISYIGYETEDSPVVTAINSTRSNTTVSHAIYNLAGQRVMNAQKGLYIINGKKVMF